MKYLKVSEAAEKWKISARRVRVLCAEGRIDGVIKKGNLYMIPENAVRPVDGRYRTPAIIKETEQKKKRLSQLRPLSPAEVQRLAEEFTVEYTYNSNAIEEEIQKEQGLEKEEKDTTGLSLGEYAALVCGKVLTFKDAVSLVRKRGQYMQNCIPDGEWRMAAIIGLEDSTVENACKEINGFVKCANYNCPGQLVIAGEKSAVEEACSKLTQAGARRTIMLNVTAPFHTEQLTEAKQNLTNDLNKVEFKSFEIPVIKNIDGTLYKGEDNMVDILSNHIVSSVRWKDSVEYMIANGVDTFIELGPGKTLSGFVKKINKDVKVFNVENEETLDKVLEIFKA